MKTTIILLFTLLSTATIAQNKHSLQVDDGLGNYSLIVAPAVGGTFTLPNGGGTLLTSNGGTSSPAWLVGGNTTPSSTFLGNNTALGNLDLRAGNATRLSLDGTTGAVTIPGAVFGVNGVSYTFPGANAVGVMTNNGSGTLSWASAAPAGWALLGNAATVNGTNFLGTTDNVAFSVKVKNAATVNNDLTLNTNGSIKREISGTTAGNARGLDAVDMQVSRTVATQVASNTYSTISGGLDNTASGTSSTVGGGYSNTASNDNATVGGGVTNIASGNKSTVAGGELNTANNGWSAIGGGFTNTASGSYSTIGGGFTNQASGGSSTVGGGITNSASGPTSTISGGQNNTASGPTSSVSGGQSNTASGTFSTIGGGYQNTAGGSFSAIPGGRGLTISAGTNGSFGFLGNNGGSNDMTIAANNVSVFGNTNLWLANNTNAASEIRFYEANATASGAFPPVNLNYTAFKAGVQTGDLTYTLPIVAPTAGQVLSSDASGVLSWATAAGGGALTNFTESLTTTAPYTATNAAARLLATNATATDITVVLQPKGNGALQAQLADNANTGGNIRGVAAVDWQMVRSGNPNQVASGQWSTIGGGRGNSASGFLSTIAGGENNTASGFSSFIGGGQGNVADGQDNVISGGLSNTISGAGTFNSAIAGGRGLTLSAGGSFGFLGNNIGFNNMTISTANTAVFGNTNLWLANNTNAASELRFYEANATASGAFPPVNLNYTAFKAGVQTVDLTYTLPIVAPTAGQVLSSDASGVLSWATAGGISGGVNNTIPIWTSASTLGNSLLTVSGTTLSYNGFFSLTAFGQVSALGGSFSNGSSNGRIMGITNTDASGGGGNSRVLDITMPNAPVATGTATGILFSIASGVGTSYDILGTSSNWKVKSSGAATFTGLNGAAANKYAEQHTVAGGEIAGNTVTIANSIVAGATSVVVATFVSNGGGGTATMVKKVVAAASSVAITFDNAPVAGDVVNYIVVNP